MLFDPVDKLLMQSAVVAAQPTRDLKFEGSNHRFERKSYMQADINI
jgi:hypothetical protein